MAVTSLYITHGALLVSAGAVPMCGGESLPARHSPEVLSRLWQMGAQK